MKYVVITACLNSAETIRRTIKSVLVQSILPEQYIFVDGGSNDNTIDVIEDEIKINTVGNTKVSYSIIHQKTGGGIYEAWNLALNSIKESVDVVFILNSDDWYEQNCTRWVAELLNNDPFAEILIASDRKYLQSDLSTGKITKNRSFRLFPLLMPVIHPACFVKLSVYKKIGHFNQTYRVSGDYEFLYRCYVNDIKIKRFDKVLVNREMGGYAEHNRVLARVETFRIGKTYAKLLFLPYIAYLLRIILRR